LSVGPPSRSFAAASVQTTSLVNPTSLLRTPLLRLWGVHETLSLHRQFATRQLSLWIPCLLVHFLAVSQLHRFRLLLTVLSLYFNISRGVGVCLLVRSLTVLPLSTSNVHPTSISTPPCVSTAGLSTLSLQRQLGRCLGRCRPLLGGSSVLSSVLFILYATPPRGSTQRVLFDWGPI